MKISNRQFQLLKKRFILSYIIAEILFLIGGIIYIRSQNFLGAGIIGLGALFFTYAWIMRNQKGYKILRREFNNVLSIRELMAQYGRNSVIGGLAFLTALLLGVVYCVNNFVTHNWPETILFVIAFYLVQDLRSYFRVNYKLGDE